MSENRLEYEYAVKIFGIEEIMEAMEQADKASKSASESVEQARKTAEKAIPVLEGARSQAIAALPTMIMGVRTFNAFRLAVEQATRAVTEFKPEMMLYAFLNIMQVIRNLLALNEMLKKLKETHASLAGVQAIVATLAGQPWLVAAAVAAGVMVAAVARSMQTGGRVEETGLYLLHKGEYVVPKERVIEKPYVIEATRETIIAPAPTPVLRPITNIHYGPFYLTVEERGTGDLRELAREYARQVARDLRRMGM